MADIRSHESVTIAPPTQFAHRMDIVLKPMAIQGVSRTGFGRNIEDMHDAGVEEGLLDGSHPADIRR